MIANMLMASEIYKQMGQNLRILNGPRLRCHNCNVHVAAFQHRCHHCGHPLNQNNFFWR